MSIEQSTTVLPLFVAEAIEQALNGDSAAWGLVYAAAAGFVRDGVPLPPPLREVVAERLQGLSNALRDPRETDKRKAVHAAAIPGNSLGRKRKSVDMLNALALDAIARAGVGADDAALKIGVAEVVRLIPKKKNTEEPLYVEQSVLTHARKLLSEKK